MSNAKEYRIKTSPDSFRTIKDPSNDGIEIMHAYVPIRNFVHGKLPDDVNPRSHEKITGRLPEAIEESLKENPAWFHLLNRGLLILAEKAWYEEKTGTLHFTIGSDDEGGLADGATTDRTLGKIKASVSATEFEQLTEEEIPDFLKDSNVHLEILSGDIGTMLVSLAGARNTSLQVKDFALENLGGGFDWLKKVLDDTEFKSRIRYREGDSEPVDVRSVLGLLTLFHPKWNEEKKEPVMGYTHKGRVLDVYKDAEWRPGFEALAAIAPDILRLYDYIHVHFPEQYEAYKETLGTKAKLGARKEIRFKERGTYLLPLTQSRTAYQLPDGWLYPILGAFRMLVSFPEGNKPASWISNPEKFFDEVGKSLVADVVETSESLGRNPQAVGKSRPLWNALRKSVELRRLNNMASGAAGRRKA